ncbi:MAG: flagellin [Lacipirellulaceae bacterium]
MSRINTNVSSLVGRNNLARANSSLSQSLTRLSTGLRINTGKDDPAGLIASENLRSDITAIKRAIGNTDRANQVIATADSSLGQVSSLLNDIRGLVTESANAGALSSAQIEANQLQLDSSLDALNRIAQTTTFQGRRLLDGSLDFLTQAGTGFSNVSDLKIDQANLGATGRVDVAINVTQAATQASLNIGGIAPGVPGANAVGSLTFADNAVASTGSVLLPAQTTAAVAGAGSLAFTVETTASVQGTGTISTTAQGSIVLAGQTIDLTSLTAGTGGNLNLDATITVNFAQANNGATRTAGAIVVNVTAADGVATVNDIITALNNGPDNAAGGTDIGVTAALRSGGVGGTTVNAAAVTAATLNDLVGGGSISLAAVDNNAADGGEGVGAKNITVQFGQAQNSSTYTAGTDTLVVNLTAAQGVATLADVVSAIGNGPDGAGSGGDAAFTATLATGTGTEVIRAGFAPATVTLAGGVNAVTGTRTINLTTAAAGAQDFNLQIVRAATSSITDASPSDGITAGISGTRATGYTVTIASDAVVDLDNLTQFLNDQITEVVTATISGSPANDFDDRTTAAAAPVGQQSVTGSQAQVTANRTIAITGETTSGALGNVALSFVRGAVVGTGTLAQRVAVAGTAASGYTITVDDSETVTFGDIASAIQGIGEIATASAGANAGDTFDTSLFNPSVGNTTLTGGRNQGTDILTIRSKTQNATFNGNIAFNTANATAGGIAVTKTGSNIAISVDATSSYSLADIRSAINSQLQDYTATLTAGVDGGGLSTPGSGTFEQDVANNNTAPVIVNLAGGLAATGGVARDAVIELAGQFGSEVLNVRAGTQLSDLVKQINQVSDAIGVAAVAGADGRTLEIKSTGYGSEAVIDLKVRQEAAGGTFTAALGSSSARRAGSDVVATVNGIAATGRGNELSINTATLDLTTSVKADFTGVAEFSINGGGALFQLGPDVVSNQQARLGIGSVNTARLGGVSGSLFQLSKGGSADLSTDATTAARIVEEAIDQVTSLRGRLGAFQRTTLETNKNALNDTLSNLTEAESSIRDVDFAEETANLTRAQILVQSGTRVLAIANQNPQNVLALLQG